MWTEQSRTEEISKAIDTLTYKRVYQSDDPCVQPLVNTAAYVRRYALSAQDTAIISQLSQRISADIAARKRRKRWLAAAVGVVAAVIIAVNMS